MKREFLGLLLGLCCSVAWGKTIVLGTTEWPPYVMKGATKGYAYEIVEKAFKAAGYDDVRIIFMPWNDAESALDQGQIDGVFPEYFSQDRAPVEMYSDAFSQSSVGFYKKNDAGLHYPEAFITDPNKPQLALQALSEFRFGVVTGYVNMELLDEDTRLNKVYANSDAENLTNLYEGRADLVFIDKYTAEYLLNHVLPVDYRTQLSFMEPALAYKKLYVGLSKKNPHAQEISDNFNQGLKIIKANGEFSKIIEHDVANTDNFVG